MSRIKGTIIKRATKELLKKYPEKFVKDFDANKKKLARDIPQKKMRNSIAGYLARIVKKQQESKVHALKLTKPEVIQTNG